MGNPIRDVWIVHDTDPTNEFKAAFVDKDDAEDTANNLRAKGSHEVLLEKVHLHHSEKDPEADESAHAPKSKPKKKKKKKSADSVIEGSGDELTRLASDATEETPKAKKSKSPAKSDTTAAAPKEIPGAHDNNSLAGLKIWFAGAIPMGHKTAEATAKKYGADVTSNPAKADYVVVGKNVGEKQNEKIEQSEAVKITEDDFVELIQIGVPNKLKRVVDDADTNGEYSTKRQRQ